MTPAAVRPGRVAVIDIGTNTVRLLVAEESPGGRIVLDEFGEVTVLGGSLVRTGRIEPAEFERTAACLAIAVRRAAEAGVECPDIVGTEVFRRATNGVEMAGAMSARIGFPIRVLSGEEEAEASYLGSVAWLLPETTGAIAVLDLGGGSIELIRGDGHRRLASRSLPVGALIITDRCFADERPGTAAVILAQSILAKELSALAPAESGLVGHERLLALGGSACAIAAWVHGIRRFDAKSIHGLGVSQEQLMVAGLELAAMTTGERMERAGVGSGRARLLPGGAVILATALQLMNRSAFETSVFGLRHGRALLAWHDRL